MAHEVHLDHPDEWSWHINHGPAPILGPCTHATCRHRDTEPVAWGPDYEHYELVVCLEDPAAGGCGGGCRGWVAAYPPGTVPTGMPDRRIHSMAAYDPLNEHRTTHEERVRADAARRPDRRPA